MALAERARAPNLRATTRHDVEIEARIEVAGVLGACVLRNVSLGGAFATTDRLPFDTQVTLCFRVPTADAVIEVDAVVRWSTTAGVGLQFGSLRARDSWALGRYLEALRGRH